MWASEARGQYVASSAQSTFIAVFGAIDEYEKLVNKPFYQFDSSEIDGMLIRNKIRSSRSLSTFKRAATDYLIWLHESQGIEVECVARHINEAGVMDTSFGDFYFSGSKRFINFLMSDLKEACGLLDEIEDSYLITAQHFILSWIGVPTEEQALLQRQDVDLIEGVVRFSGRLLRIDDALVDIMKDYASMKGVFRQKAKGGRQMIPFKPSDLYIKSTRNAELQDVGIRLRATRFRAMITNAKKIDTQGYLSGKQYYLDRIYKSGFYSRGYAIQKDMGIKLTKDVAQRELFAVRVFGNAAMNSDLPSLYTLLVDYEFYLRMINRNDPDLLKNVMEL